MLLINDNNQLTLAVIVLIGFRDIDSIIIKMTALWIFIVITWGGLLDFLADIHFIDKGLSALLSR